MRGNTGLATLKKNFYSSRTRVCTSFPIPVDLSLGGIGARAFAHRNREKLKLATLRTGFGFSHTRAHVRQTGLSTFSLTSIACGGPESSHARACDTSPKTCLEDHPAKLSSHLPHVRQTGFCAPLEMAMPLRLTLGSTPSPKHL